jgi:hypothetical protein
MDITEILNLLDIRQLRKELDALRERDSSGWDPRRMKELAEEHLELKLRVGLLVRLLIAKGVFTAEEFAGLIAGAQGRQ